MFLALNMLNDELITPEIQNTGYIHIGYYVNHLGTNTPILENN